MFDCVQKDRQSQFTIKSMIETTHDLQWAHPVVRDWFVNRFGTPTEPQALGWPHILSGATTLIAAPTGSGKTLAAFLACIDRLVRRALAGELDDKTYVVYVSPLKALSNDIQKNLEGPLHEILSLAAERGLLMQQIRTAVRTGDTLATERRAMLKRPPHILVTTPESLYILLTAEKSSSTLKNVETVIVDEIHAVADDKRGAHLSLSLERLEWLALGKPARIGLSATQKPIEVIANFLAGNDRPLPVIVDVGHKRQMDIALEVPPSPLGPVASNEMWDEIYDRITSLANEHRSTLVFVNTRRLTERLAHNLAERLGEEQVAAHHGSLSRRLRLTAENKLKNGEIKVLVATASLELGIDIGFVDLVCQIGSPRAINVALQRIGRAGHWRGAIPKGRIFATTRDELTECAALIRAIRKGDLDRLHVPEAPLDILAQQIVAMCASAEWTEDELFCLVRRSFPYRNLSMEIFDSILEMLSEGISAQRGRYGSYLMRDRVNHKVRAKRGGRLAAITSGGAIPDNALFTVVAEPDGATVGTLDEDFAVESNRGDIMLLGNTSWRIRRVESAKGRVLVEDAHGAPPTVPFWLGEAPARTTELSEHVAQIREEISKRFTDNSVLHVIETSSGSHELASAKEWLTLECGLDDSGSEQLIEYILQGRAVLGAVPTQKTIIAERFFDEGGGMQLVIHAPFGGRINKAWGLALRKRFCRSFNFELQASATEDGLSIALSEQHSFPLADVFHFLSSETVSHVLEQAALASPIFGTRFRWDANRSLALLRFMHGKKVPAQIQRMRSEDLLAAVFPQAAACQDNIDGEIEIPDHPLVTEVMKDVLTEALDLEGLQAVLSDIESGDIKCIAVDTPEPSQFSHEIFNANPYAYLDDAPLEERRARAVEMRRMLPQNVLKQVGQLDKQAITQVVEEAWLDIRDADELHDALLTLVALPEDLSSIGRQPPQKIWGNMFEQLETENRVTRVYVTTGILPANAPAALSLAAQLPIIGHTAKSAQMCSLLGPPDENGIATKNTRAFWVAAERLRTFSTAYPESTYDKGLPDVSSQPSSFEDAVLYMVRGWMSHVGPTTAKELSLLLTVSENRVDVALLNLESQGAILRGRFRQADNAQTEWCDRRLLARIHRLTVSTLRKQIEAVTAQQFMQWLTHWQHVAPGTQLAGERGLLEVISQLQGLELPANVWEWQIFDSRLRDYDPPVLDKVCLAGAVGWGRLSPHPATLGSISAKDEKLQQQEPNSRISDTLEDASFGQSNNRKSRKRVVPTSVAPITFFLRNETDWMIPRHTADKDGEPSGLGHSARSTYDFLKLKGASFFADIVHGTNQLKSEAEAALWELVSAGLVTADGFDNLRALIDPKRRAGRGSARNLRPRHSTGRWAMLHTNEPVDRARSVESACWLLLNRYGVVFRDILARETLIPSWRELLIAFRRLEDRGEIRGGRFVDGFIGEQFALPVAVDSLRAMRDRKPMDETIVLSAADPLNLIGIILPGERIPAISRNSVMLQDGTAARSPVPQ